MKKIVAMTVSALLAGCVSHVAQQPLTDAQLEGLWKDPHKNAELILSQMTTKEKIGQMLMLDIRQWDENPQGYAGERKEETSVHALPAALADMIYDYRLGGIILFRENFMTTAQSYKLIEDIQSARYRLPLLIGTDQEGGYVTRLREGTEMPGNMALAATRDISMAKGSGEIHGSELSALGVNINFAPSVDVNVNQNNPVIGVRSFSSDTGLINDMASAYIDGLQKHHVTATIKHFPGHGNVETDSHVGLPVVPYSEQEWRQNDLVPFKYAIDNGIKAIMTGHIVVPALDNSKVISRHDGKEMGLPATLSKKILTDILRNELHYKGLVFTDALDMGAVADNFGTNEAVEQAYLAGVDVAVMPVHIWDKQGMEKLASLYQYIEKQSQVNPELAKRINESALRVVEYKLDNKLLPQPMYTEAHALSVVASAEHKNYERKVAEKSVTLIENKGVLPFTLKKQNNILVISDEKARNELIKKELNQISSELKGKTIDTTGIDVDLSGQTLPQGMDKQINHSDFIILVTYNLKAQDNAAQSIINLAAKYKKPVVVISSRNPYDISALKNVKANIAIYGITGFDITNAGRNSLEANIKAGIRSLFKDSQGVTFNNPTGKLPVDIKASNGKVIYPLGHGMTY
ncbi:beta-N-acetylhexosaminidase [Klebsiella sp. BIGb0407]|nr:beta-N-acetylhexosaminidase [Klebsiella sp. BIGb0407]